MRGALIDDCALGALMKRQGPIWLGLTEGARSLRAYPALCRFQADGGALRLRRNCAIRRFGWPARSPGWRVTYLAPPLFALFAHGVAQWAGALAWAMMASSLTPTLRLYRSPAGSAASLCPPSPPPMSSSRRSPPCNIGAGAAAMERPRSGPDAGGGGRMTTATEALSGKTHRDENFPVASRLMSAAIARPDPRLLSLRARRRRRRRSSVASGGSESSRRSTLLDATLCGDGPRRCGGRTSAPRACGARPRPAPRPRPDRRLSPRCEQEPLRRLGRADGLLPPLGDAGRPLRPRRSWRGQALPGPPPTRCARRCR